RLSESIDSVLSPVPSPKGKGRLVAGVSLPAHSYPTGREGKARNGGRPFPLGEGTGERTEERSNMAASGAPAGEVTLMFTDIEGSTRGWDTYRERFHEALQRHNALIREAIAAWNGYEVKTIGDSFMVAFSDPLDAALCALEVQRRIENGPFAAVGGMRVRVGLHTGLLEPIGGDYFGPPVNRAARIERAAHGGMILLSADTAQR